MLPAPLISRSLAHAFDRAFTLFFTSTVLELLGTIGWKPSFLISLEFFLLVDFVYFCPAQWLAGGTLGGILFGVRVVKKGRGADPTRLIARWFIFWLSIFMFGLAQLMAALNPERKTLYDLLSGTRICSVQ